MQHIPACGSLRNLLLTISYDGKEFHGWQIQQNAMTVQEAFQTALSKIIGDDFDVKGMQSHRQRSSRKYVLHQP